MYYGDESMTLVWDEHSIRQRYTVEDGGDFALNAEIGLEFFRLVNMQVKTPAEHTFDGQRRDLELQTEHFDPETGLRLGLAVTFEAVDSLPEVEFDSAEKIVEDETWTLVGQDLLERLLSEDQSEVGAGKLNGDINMLYRVVEQLPFYVYKGTFTHPDCALARWIVVKHAFKAKRETIEVFRKHLEGRGTFLTGNARQVQPLREDTKVVLADRDAPSEEPVYRKRDWLKFNEMQEREMEEGEVVPADQVDG